MNGEASPNESGEFLTRSPQETMQLGKILGEWLAPGDAVALIGDLGAGKTTLAKGIACGAGVEDEGDVTSPTFVLVNEYQGRFPVYHADLYRLQEAHEVEDLGWEEFIFGNGISLMEWAEKIPGILPEDRIEIRISWLSAEERKFVITGKGAKAQNIVRLLQRKWEKEE
jgi:tRNA threonylcarbamoyladenosine biosynthesis protein TsaE